MGPKPVHVRPVAQVSDSESSIVDKRGSGAIDWACDEEGDEDGQSRDPGTPPGSPPPSVQPRTPTLAHGGSRPRVEGPCQVCEKCRAASRGRRLGTVAVVRRACLQQRSSARRCCT